MDGSLLIRGLRKPLKAEAVAAEIMSMTTGNGFGGRNGLDELAEALQRAHAGVVSLAEQERKLQEREAKLAAERAAIDARDEAIAALERVQSEAVASLAAREVQVEQREAEVRHREEAAARWFSELSEAHRVIGAQESEAAGVVRVDEAAF